MKGLYRRALEIKSMLPPQSANGITAEEQREIEAQIESVVARNRAELSPEDLSFRAEQPGHLFPTLVNVVAVALLLLGIPALLWAFNRQERSFLTRTQAVTGAEGRLLREMREEAERQLAAKDREVQAALEQANALAAERDRARREAAERIRERETELARELQARLERERERLSGQEQNQVDARLAELETRLAERHARELEEFAEKREDELRRRESELEREIRESSALAEAAQAERGRLARALPETGMEAGIETGSRAVRSAGVVLTLQPDVAAQERMALDQMRSLYQSVREDAAEGEYERAAVTLSQIERFVETVELPALRSMRSVELATVGAMRELIETARTRPTVTVESQADRVLADLTALTDQADRRLRAGDRVGAENLYRAALQGVPAVRRSHEQLMRLREQQWTAERRELERRLENLLGRVTALEEERVALESRLGPAQDTNRDLRSQLAAARARHEARDERQAALLSGLRGAAEIYGPGAVEAESDVVDLLRTKALLKQVVDSGPVRAQYPGLYDAMELYFEEFGAQKYHEGEAAALENVLKLLDDALGVPSAGGGGASAESADTVSLFNAIVERLERLIG